jgi:two-component system, NarL family, response regulator NreC
MKHAAERIILSPRETEVLVAVCLHGQTNREIAARLGIARSTVSHYVRRLMEAIGARRRGDLVRWAVAHPGALCREPVPTDYDPEDWPAMFR